MPMTPGLVPNIREVAPDNDDQFEPMDVAVEIIEDGADRPEFDERGNIIEIKHADGSITVSLDGRPIEDAEKRGPTGWFDNLAEEIDEGDLHRIADELIRGIDDDITSRREWIEDRSQGIKLLGLKIEIPGLQGATDGAPVEGMSKVRHPLLLEAVLRFQANARSELLPTDGPVKIRNDSNNATLQQDQLANALQRDMNHYLTSVATEYYPDTDRMLLMLGFGGTAFKKVYFCPLRNRPVSESVDANDLIVNNNATDLRNAKRITHRVFMRPSVVKRLQILGVYRDIDLGTPKAADLDAVQREKDAQQGINRDAFNPDDRDREIYECYCELDIPGFEHKWKGKETGLEIPYRVTIDVSSRQVLSIVRNYNEDDQELPTARANFVKYTFVPGMGFYDIGLLHILGNTTNAITAAWRELLDAGMYNNFPGFLMADTGARQNTNIFRVPPGGGALVKTNGMPITQAVMPLPYKEPSGALMNLVNQMADTGMRVGGASEVMVTEGKQDAPVGTTLAMIEQATKVLNSVHKRMHAAQAEEFELLMQCFREHPDSFWQRRGTTIQWDENTFMAALKDVSLVPQADPNTSSQMQRLMKVAALKQLVQQNPSLYDPIAVDTAALQALGWSNPQQFMVPAAAQGKPPPELLKALSDIENDKKNAEARMLDSITRAKETDADIALKMAKAEADSQRMDGQITDETMFKAEEDRKARLSNERVQLIDLAQDIVQHPEAAPLIEPLIRPAMEEIAANPPKPPGLV